MRQIKRTKAGMVIRKNRRRIAAMLALLGVAGAASLSHAATYNWVGGSGNWDTTTANWTGAGTTWPTTGTDNDALFAGTAGTVTLTTGITVNDIQFSTTGYTVTGNTLTLNGTTPTITVDPTLTDTISSIIAGSAGLTKAGTGTLVLTGANTYTAGTTVSAGTLQIGNGTVNGTIGSGAYSVASGATLRLNYATASGPTWANITGAGTLSLNSAQAVNGTANWGTTNLGSGFTGTLVLEKGRVDTNPTRLGGTTTVDVRSGGAGPLLRRHSQHVHLLAEFYHRRHRLG